MAGASLDRLDLRILTTLQENGRITNRELAERVSLSQSACLDRVRRLMRDGFIRGYMALLEPAKLGDWVTVFAQVTLDSHGNQRQKAFEERVAASPEIVECAEVGGQFDYMMRVVCPSLSRYQDLTAALIEDESLGVSEIKSHIVMRDIRRFEGYPLETLLTDGGA